MSCSVCDDRQITADSRNWRDGTRVAEKFGRPLGPSTFLRSLRICGVLSLLGLGACSAQSAAADLTELSDVGALEVCDGQTFAELEHAKTISDGCKAEVEPYLPSPSDNFHGHV